MENSWDLRKAKLAVNNEKRWVRQNTLQRK